MAKRIAWIGDAPALNTGFGTTARNVLGYLAAEGFSVVAYTVSSPFDINYNYEAVGSGGPKEVNYPIRVLAGREAELDSFDAVIGTWNPKYISQAAIYYDQVWPNIKTRRIGYFVHEDRYVPHHQGEFYYKYQGDYDLVLTTPSQDIWGYSAKYADKVHFIPHALPLDVIKNRMKKYGKSERKYVTAVMANNNIRKRWDIIIQAIPEIKWSEYRFVTQPDGLFKIIDMLDWVKSTGTHFHADIGLAEDIWEVYAQTKVLVNPTAGEAFSYPIAEALAAGASVVATDLPELRELYGSAITYVASHPMLEPDGPLQLEPSRKDFVQKVNRVLAGGTPHPEAVEKFDIKKVGPLWADLIANDRPKA